MSKSEKQNKNLGERPNLTTAAKQEIIASFAELISGSDNVNDLVWEVVNHINLKLNYDDCVIYLQDKSGTGLIQVAAYGEQKVDKRNLKNPIYIESGEGIVGRVFQFGDARIVPDTSKDANYIIDDRFRLSEISVPLAHNEKTIGVIDSEHPSENYYTTDDLEVLKAVAKLMAERIQTIDKD